MADFALLPDQGSADFGGTMKLWGAETGIGFEKLGIWLSNVPRGFTLFNFDFAFYGVVIAIGALLGLTLSMQHAKRNGEDPDLYYYYAIPAILIGVLGARIYYIIFNFEIYRDNPLLMLNIRDGGLAIYGGIIAAVVWLIIYSRMKKASFWLMTDTACLGLLVGQIFGRWGNFFNREVFGKFSDGLFSMQIDITCPLLWPEFNPQYVSDAELAQMYLGRDSMLQKIIEVRQNIYVNQAGVSVISVHPTFLYESLCNLALLIILLIYSKHKKFDGEMFIYYVGGYGLVRFFIEGVRTDQLFIGNTALAVSQVLSAILVAAAVVMWFILRSHAKKKGTLRED